MAVVGGPGDAQASCLPHFVQVSFALLFLVALVFAVNASSQWAVPSPLPFCRPELWKATALQYNPSADKKNEFGKYVCRQAQPFWLFFLSL